MCSNLIEVELVVGCLVFSVLFVSHYTSLFLIFPRFVFQVDLPIFFFIDPLMGEDSRFDHVDRITLSYLFFESDSDLPDEYVEYPCCPFADERADYPTAAVSAGVSIVRLSQARHSNTTVNLAFIRVLRCESSASHCP